MKTSHRLLEPGAVALLSALVLFSSLAHAQSVPIPGAADAEAEITAAAEQRTELRNQVERLEQRITEWKEKADAFEKAQQTAPERLAEIAREIEALETEAPLSLDGEPIAQLEVGLLKTEQDLALAQRQAAELQLDQDRRPERRRELPELLARARARTSELEQAPPLTLADDEAVADLQQQVATLRKRALQEEVRSHELELVGYESRGEVLDANLRLAKLQIARDQRHLEQLRTALAAQREDEAEVAAREAMASVARVDSLDPAVKEAVRQLALENAQLVQGRTGEDGLLEAIDDVSRKLSNADQRVSNVEADYQRLSERVQSVGLSDSVGLLLRKTRSEIPDVGKYQRFIRMRQEKISEVQDRQAALREELASLSQIDKVVESTVARYADSLSTEQRGNLADVLRDLLVTKRKHVKALLDDYDVYFQKLVDFDARQQELIDKTHELLAFIDQRVLWVPSGGAVHAGIFDDALGGLRWVSEGRYWGQLLRAIHAVFLETLYLGALALLAMVGAIFALPRRLAPRLAELAGLARQPTCTDILPTLEATGLCLALVPWGPAALGLLGWQLGNSPDATLFVRCFAGGFVAAAWMWLALELPRQLLRRDGLGEAHFTWPVDAVRRLRGEIGSFAAIAVPLVFTIQIFELRGEDLWRESIGRVALIALLLATAFIGHRTLRDGGALRSLLRATPSIGAERSVWQFVHLAVIAIPVALAVAATRGYFWTALRLDDSYHLTLLFLLVLLFAFQFAVRWSLVARRRIAFQLARDKREAERAAREKIDDDAAPSERPPPIEDEIDLAMVDAQTERLLVTTAVVAIGLGLWLLWVEVVPAFGVLDTVELWTSAQQVTLESTAADGARVLETEERIVPFTLADLMFAALVAFMTFVLVRNLAGLLEISLFRYLGTAAGERYAYTMIAKYTVTLVGGVLAFNAVGLGWANVQWLVAAVGLGLGFGLQEIFANFVAGLIILVERPIRVGDTVTIGAIDGTVSKIRIRATWITSFDRKELVVPNKEFVTTQLVNWSLTDPLVRVDVPVGIAYGSDTEAAMRALYAVAEANPHVIADPRPDVLFLGFGDSALDFELRVYSPDVSHRLVIKHALHLAIDRAFREAGIEIAFPQRDLHVRTLPAASDSTESDPA